MKFLRETSEKQAASLTQLTQLVTALNLKYDQIVSKVGDSGESGGSSSNDNNNNNNNRH
jgi:hypothetical protein